MVSGSVIRQESPQLTAGLRGFDGILARSFMAQGQVTGKGIDGTSSIAHQGGKSCLVMQHGGETGGTECR